MPIVEPFARLRGPITPERQARLDLLRAVTRAEIEDYERPIREVDVPSGSRLSPVDLVTTGVGVGFDLQPCMVDPVVALEETTPCQPLEQS